MIERRGPVVISALVVLLVWLIGGVILAFVISVNWGFWVGAAAAKWACLISPP